ncbi:MAG: glycosyltransferase family 39 protein [Saprospiraceae bacterium]|nr:glycosyltransferase family 39 protein [Saprospiraceae bacterium]
MIKTEAERIQYPVLLWMIAILILVVSFYRLGTWGVIDTSEARYAEIGRQMYESGDYLHPVYLGIEHYHKPPMTYWITAAGYHLFGVNPFAARFFLQCALLLQLLLSYRITGLIYTSSRVSFYATMIYASFMIVWVSVRNLTTDAYLNTFLLLSTWSLFAYLFRQKVRYLYLFALFFAMAFLTKITAVFVFMGSLFLFIFWKYRSRIRWSWHMLGAGMLALMISGSWFLLLQMEGKSVLEYMLYEQSVVRYTSDTFRRSMPFYFYFVAGPLLTFPWFFLVLIQMIKRRNLSEKKHDLLLLGFCLLLPLFFFSISHSKLLLYVLPAFWALAVVGGKMLDQMSDEAIRVWIRLQSIWIILLFSTLLILPIIDSQYILGTTILLLIGISLCLFLYIYLNKILSPPFKLVTLSVGLTLSLIMMSSHFLTNNEEDSSTGKIAAEWIVNHDLGTRQVFIYDKLAPSFAFHLKKDIALIGDREKRELQFEQSDQWKKYYYDLEDSVQKEALLSALRENAVLICRSKRVAEIDPNILRAFTNKYQTGLWTIFY